MGKRNPDEHLIKISEAAEIRGASVSAISHLVRIGERQKTMTGEEMERAIEFLLQNQATLEERIEQVNRDLGGRIAELTAVVRMQADSQSQLNQTLTTAITALAEAQAKTEAKMDRLAGVVEKLVERLSP